MMQLSEMDRKKVVSVVLAALCKYKKYPSRQQISKVLTKIINTWATAWAESRHDVRVYQDDAELEGR
jgi:hypothetical protein